MVRGMRQAHRRCILRARPGAAGAERGYGVAAEWECGAKEVVLIYIGIDPGKKGALALINGECASVEPIPIIQGGKRARDEYDLVAIRDWLLKCKELSKRVSPGLILMLVTVEKSQPLPPKFGGGISNYHRGCSTGWAWMLTGLGIRFQLPPSRQWQKVMHLGTSGDDTKQKSIVAAQRLFPDVSLRRTEKCRKLDDGLADALLLAEFGRRTDYGR